MNEIIDPNSEGVSAGPDVICFCHLRWDFVYQRPQHLMSRFARSGRVFVIEEPIHDTDRPRLDVSERDGNVFVCTLHLPEGLVDDRVVRSLLADLVDERDLTNYIVWFYTPMMIEWSRELKPKAVIYDCMDELALFKNAPPELIPREQELFGMADLVFTGGQSLYEAKREQHRSVHAFPSSIEREHFGKARDIEEEFADQAHISHPRVGFIGVIDERLDIGLLDKIAELRPDISFVMVGPVIKISDDDLPKRDNIYYLGQRSYDELPPILAGWDAAMMPFALNDSTKYISPTKTPEFLSAGLPVVSTPIRDVVRPYGDRGLVEIASTPDEFAEAIQRLLVSDPASRIPIADEFLADLSWDKTYGSMKELIDEVIDGGESLQRSAEAG